MQRREFSTRLPSLLARGEDLQAQKAAFHPEQSSKINAVG